MTQILLISDIARVKRFFESLEKKGSSLQLRTAATLMQADEEIAASAPEFTFVQSRIFGLSSDIIVRHLRKMLPAGAKIVFLTSDADEMKQAGKAEHCVDLTLDDEALAHVVSQLLGSVSLPRSEVAAEPVVRTPRSQRAKVSPAPKIAKPAVVPGPVPDKPAGGSTLTQGLQEKPGKSAAAGKPAKHKVVKSVSAPGPTEDKSASAPAPGPTDVRAASVPVPGPAEGKIAPPTVPGPPDPVPRPVPLPEEDGLAPTPVLKPAEDKKAQGTFVADPVPGASGGSAVVPPPVEEAPAPEPQPTKVPDQKGSPPELSPQGGTAGTGSFDQIMRRASFQVDPLASDPVGEDRVTLSESPADATGRSALSGRSEPAASPVSVGDFSYGEPLSDAMYRAKDKERPFWPLAVGLTFIALALICIPIFSYLAGRRVAPPEPPLAPRAPSRPTPHPNGPVPIPATTGSAKSPAAPTAAAPALSKTAAPASSSLAKPAPKLVPEPQQGKAAAKPETKPAAKPPEPSASPVAKPVAKPAEKAGVKSLPPVVSQAVLDTAYGKTHPGWQRYLSNGIEYKLFKEAGVYRALQVLARNGESIPEQLFKRALLEFGGTESYRLKPSGEKGKYLVEQGETKSGKVLTLYRSKADHRMKAFVLYYH